ncbi:flagellar hook assembly protein FlgD [Teichococcus vastitatis]|uniref:Basal-body rod modification protein FlgD n=1 Tax=Teichococcus vastitatis TaxID=2307076 RepID=A0ABS9W679_9PROT|nr:flagellar hook capping FlgD N-terminal domain-containing protein [Pseudoroseomonas vastitatis]MCI0754797.1 flagellar hook assembly protein FlgD [Pseudoroseomonas vastitatis]
MATTSSITATSAAGPAGGTTGSTSTTATTQLKSSSEDFDRFLTLLTAQMKYQDPMQPTDPTQFVAQLAQFSQVEQQTKSNTYLKTISEALTNSASLSENAAMLGRTVQTEMSEITLSSSGATVPLNLTVSSSTLSGTRLEVVNSAGQVVRKVNLNSGSTNLTFDGKDNSGLPLSGGKYTVRVVGEDADSTRQTAGTVSSSGKITEVRRDSSGSLSLLLDNGNLVSAKEVTRLAAG